MSKRYFKIETGRYGGEVVCGEVTPEFYEYWLDRDNDDLLQAFWNDGEDQPDSPKPGVDDDEYWTPWHDLDDFLHLSTPYADNHYYVTEIAPKEGVTYDEEWGAFEASPEWTDENGYDFWDEVSEDREGRDYISLASQELYGNRDNFGNDNCVPVMFFHSAEKGAFGEVIVVTDGADFNPAKFRIDMVETDIGEFIQSYWYDKKLLPVNYDWSDSIGKSSNVYLTVLDVEDHKKWFKPFDKYQEDIEEFWEADEDVL